MAGVPMLVPFQARAGGQAVNMGHNCYSIHVRGTFNETMALQFKKAVDYVTNFSGCRNALYIYIQSFGGSTFALGDMINTLRAAQTTTPGLTITTIADGWAMSAGFFLWAMGDKGKRYVQGKLSVLMAHSMQLYKQGGSSTTGADLSEAKTNIILEAMLFDVIDRQLGLNLKELIDSNNGEIYLYGEHMTSDAIYKSVTLSKDSEKYAAVVNSFKASFCNDDFCAGVRTVIMPIVEIECSISEMNAGVQHAAAPAARMPAAAHITFE